MSIVVQRFRLIWLYWEKNSKEKNNKHVWVFVQLRSATEVRKCRTAQRLQIVIGDDLEGISNSFQGPKAALNVIEVLIVISGCLGDRQTDRQTVCECECV